MEFGDKWSGFASFRYDKITNKLEDNLKIPYDVSGDVDFSRATGKVGITFTPLKELSIYANWGQGFVPPATEELALNPDGFGGFNKNLVSATSMGEEIGFRYSYKNLAYLDFAGFYLKTENDFDRYRLPWRVGETFYRNAASSNRFGGEVYLKLTPIKYVTFQAAYTYSNFKYKIDNPIRVIMDDTSNVKYIQDGNFLPNSPEHQLYADIEFYPFKGLAIGFSGEAYSRSYIDGANLLSESLPGFGLFNARISYKLNYAGMNGEISFAVRNVFDRVWIAFTEPDPGGNSYQPGSIREIFGSIKIGF